MFEISQPIRLAHIREPSRGTTLLDPAGGNRQSQTCRFTGARTLARFFSLPARHEAGATLTVTISILWHSV